MTLRLAALLAIAPRAVPRYVLAFANAESVFYRFGIDTPQRVEHFLAQVLHESSGLEQLVENLNYSAGRIAIVWPRRFPTRESAEACASNPEALANKVYGGRLGNSQPGDGWRFIGRGMLQITGRANYERIGEALGLDLAGDPLLAIDPEHSLSVAACLWQDHGCNVAADTDDVRVVTRLINGGENGLDSRAQWLKKARGVVS